jgi:hypothetical protein
LSTEASEIRIALAAGAREIATDETAHRSEVMPEATHDHDAPLIH